MTDPRVSIVILNYNNPEIINVCLRSLTLTEGIEYEVVVVDNGSRPEVAEELYYPRVRKGGRMYLHDTDLVATGNAPPTPQPDYPVLTAMKEFCAEHDLEWENNPNNSGLGTIYC